MRDISETTNSLPFYATIPLGCAIPCFENVSEGSFDVTVGGRPEVRGSFDVIVGGRPESRSIFVISKTSSESPWNIEHLVGQEYGLTLRDGHLIVELRESADESTVSMHRTYPEVEYRIFRIRDDEV
jgi:hypothetical protein